MKIPCRKCLLEGVSEEQVQEKIAEYLSAMPEAERTPEADYSNRLAKCADCPSLSNGLCVQCGCFVLYRAGKLSSHCPLGEDRW